MRNLSWSVSLILLSAVANAAEFALNIDRLDGSYDLVKDKGATAAILSSGLAECVSLSPDGLGFVRDTAGQDALAGFALPLGLLAGKRLCVTAELERDIHDVEVQWQGASLFLSCHSGGKSDWPGSYMGPGKFPLETRSFFYDVPADADSLGLYIGIKQALGTITYRSIRLEAPDTIVDLRKSANMAYADETSADGRGGWSDQGRNNDASAFKFENKVYAGIPFAPLDPQANGDTSVITFASDRFPGGVKTTEVDLTRSATHGKYLYLLHTLTWGYRFKDVVGYVDLLGKNGQTLTIPVRGSLDIGDWWNANRLPNGFPAATWSNNAGGIVSLYASKFRLQDDLGELAKITFRSAITDPVWILVAATISEKDYPFPQTQVITITEGEEWGLPAKRVQPCGVIEDSILDMTSVFPVRPVDETGRVLINPDGLLAFSSAPERPVRFICNTILREPFTGFRKSEKILTDKKATEEYAVELRRQGYNMIRFHYIDDVIMSKDEDFEFNPTVQDQFDYLVYCMKQQGIYACVDAMSRRNGYSAGYAWGPATPETPNYKRDMYFDPKVRENWAKGFAKLLCHVNPYTNTALKDDPVLALIVAYNEQEFSWSSADLSASRPEWQAFLKQKYVTIADLCRAWGDKTAYKSFDDIPALSPGDINATNPLGLDATRFVYEKECELLQWYVSTTRATGTKALITNYNMGHDLLRMGVRKYGDYIAMNGYHAHPFGNVSDCRSSVSISGQIIRGFTSTREYGKPVMITEHGHGFWNKYRYEQGFVMGAYGALQDLSGLAAFGNPVTTRAKSLQQPLRTFGIENDPIIKAEEVVTIFAFRRGDVSPARHLIRYDLDIPSAIANRVARDAMYPSQSCAALVTKIAVNVDPDRELRNGELAYPICGGNPIIFHREGYQQATETESMGEQFEFSRLIADLKAKSDLPADNVSDYEKRIFQSETGELFLDADKSFMSVNTPRMQGICGLAGTTAELKDVTIENMTVDGNLVVIAKDGIEPIAAADRLLIVFATNACNSNMKFEDDSFRTKLTDGDYPFLLRKGAFALSVRHPSPEGFKAYALGPDGNRLSEIPLQKTADRFSLEVDTGKLPDGVSVYFELALRS